MTKKYKNRIKEKYIEKGKIRSCRYREERRNELIVSLAVKYYYARTYVRLLSLIRRDSKY